jgi:hypothetical protein
VDILQSLESNIQNIMWFNLLYWGLLSVITNDIHLLLTQCLNYKMIYCHLFLEKNGGSIADILRNLWEYLEMDNKSSSERATRYQFRFILKIMPWFLTSEINILRIGFKHHPKWCWTLDSIFDLVFVYLLHCIQSHLTKWLINC